MKKCKQSNIIVYQIVCERIDIFGQSISLNINKEQNYTTAFGGIASISIIGIVFLFFSSNIISFFGRENLTTSSQTLFEADPSEIVLNTDNYMFALSIEQINFNERPYFNITVQTRDYQRQVDGNVTKDKQYLNLVPCTIDHFRVFAKNGQNITDQFNQLQFQSWLCPEINYHLVLKGTYSSALFNFVKIVATECKNNTSPNQQLTWRPQCASEAERQDHLKSEGQFKLQMYSSNAVINPTQPQQYRQYYLDSEMYFTFVPKKLSRQANIFYRKYQLANDQSLLPIEDFQNEDVYIRQSDDYRDLTELGRDTDDSYAIIYVRRSAFTEQIQRQYQKISDLLSYLGGFLQIMIVFFGLFVAFYNKTSSIYKNIQK